MLKVKSQCNKKIYLYFSKIAPLILKQFELWGAFTRFVPLYELFLNINNSLLLMVYICNYLPCEYNVMYHYVTKTN